MSGRVVIPSAGRYEVASGPNGPVTVSTSRARRRHAVRLVVLALLFVAPACAAVATAPAPTTRTIPLTPDEAWGFTLLGHEIENAQRAALARIVKARGLDPRTVLARDERGLVLVAPITSES